MQVRAKKSFVTVARPQHGMPETGFTEGEVFDVPDVLAREWSRNQLVECMMIEPSVEIAALPTPRPRKRSK